MVPVECAPWLSIGVTCLPGRLQASSVRYTDSTVSAEHDELCQSDFKSIDEYVLQLLLYTFHTNY